ncbi:preprotein translocase subunit SecY [Candidatus Micrarchaeota archaeon CG10_big_fil_rev_8_21_14_0_10_59_7]|nr:MAG: preprotein translocase subunit SecY [Candidatus Micrarchaeota archaeon CG10_big_fil_rev_8_21_14_0_10_59_7]
MSIFDVVQPITALLPDVKRPERAHGLKERLMWTVAALLIFFFLGQIYPIGVDPSAITQRFERLDILLGSKTGTLITAGIGPIVLASIFLQLAVGSKLISLDLSNPENKKRFQGMQKLLAILLSFFEAAIYTFSGYIPAGSASPLFGSLVVTQILVTLQLALGSIILLYLDEVVQKCGIGSGISLFIAAGVSQTVFISSFSFITTATGVPAGLIPQVIYYLAAGDIVTSVWAIMPILFTIVVFSVVVYVEGMKIELPLAYGRARGLGARYPIKFLYVSNIPVILASAVLLNMQLIGMFAANAGFPVLGNYQSNQPIDGLAYYITALPSPLLVTGGYASYLQMIMQPNEILHISIYGIALVLLCVVFGWFWIESTGMGAHDVALQLEKTGLMIPGFRADPRVTEKILERYIPIITILGSLFVGILAWFADITGALGTGTGILLTVGILYRFYEDLAQQQVFEMYPVLKKIVRT